MRHHDEIVVGHSLAAVTYAYLNDAALILNSQDSTPFLFDFFEPDFDLTAFALRPVIYKMQTPDGIRAVGFSKNDLWNRALFAMSVAGKLPLSNKLSSMRIDEHQRVATFITSGGTKVEYSYNTLRIFNIDNIQGVSFLDTPEKYRVFDWFNVRSGCCHEYDYLFDDSDLAREIYFYPSVRMGAKRGNVKDLVAVSRLSKEQMNDIEYSDVAVRFKILDMMRRAGIRGARNGRDTRNPSKYKYYAVRIEAEQRHVESYGVSSHPSSDCIIYDTRTEEEIISAHSVTDGRSYNMLHELIKTSKRHSNESYRN